MNRTQRGRSGEQTAAVYLQGLGHYIVTRNYYTRNGEIDLITRINDRLHFIEVKTWRLSSENLEYSIDNRKIHRIQCTARDFLAKNDGYRNCEKQFDVVYITEPDHSVHYIPQAFEGGAE